MFLPAREQNKSIIKRHAKEIEAKVDRAYNAHFDVISAKLKDDRKLDSVRANHFRLTKEMTKLAHENSRNDLSFDHRLMAAYHAVFQLTTGEFDEDMQYHATGVQYLGKFQLCCFLLSEGGYLFGKGMYERTDAYGSVNWSFKVNVVKTHLLQQVASQDLRRGESYTADRFQCIAMTCLLLEDNELVEQIRQILSGQPRLARFADLFFTIRKKRNYRLNMHPLNHIDNASRLTFRLLTFLKYPKESALCGEELALSNFVSTCFKDEIGCTRCGRQSSDLQLRDNPQSYKFHARGCQRVQESRESFRITTFRNVSPSNQRIAATCANNGLFSSEDGKQVICYICCKSSSIHDYGNNNRLAKFHQDGCEFSSGRAFNVPLDRRISDGEMRRIFDSQCTICRQRLATIMFVPCSHILFCVPCLNSFDVGIAQLICPQCGNSVLHRYCVTPLV